MMKKRTFLMLGVTAGVLISLNTAMNNMQAAEPNTKIEASTRAEVKFSSSEEGTTESPNPDKPGVVKPESNGPNAPGGGSNTENPNLQLNWVPNFIFGQEDGNKGFVRNIAYDKNVSYRLPVERQLAIYTPFNEDNSGLDTENTSKQRIDNYVQVHNSKKVSDWTLKVNISEFKEITTGEAAPNFTVEINQLKLSEKNGKTPEGEQLAKINEDLAEKLKENQVVKLTSEKEVALMSFEGGTAAATNTLVFGDPNKFYDEKENASNAVTLNIPRNQDIANNSTYVAQLNWILSGDVK